MKVFPNVGSLAQADLKEVLILWQGLGYNRRARYLYESAKLLALNGTTHDAMELTMLPGVGINTAGAISVYVFNKPVVFVETNIRTVIIEHYFSKKSTVTDTEILDVLRRLIRTTHLDPRNWYWAVMDYGTYLKSSVKNVQKSAHFVKQTPFNGSARQLRSAILRSLLDHDYTQERLLGIHTDTRSLDVIHALVRDKLVVLDGRNYAIAK